MSHAAEVLNWYNDASADDPAAALDKLGFDRFDLDADLERAVGEAQEAAALVSLGDRPSLSDLSASAAPSAGDDSGLGL